MEKNTTKTIGTHGESLAAQLLKEKGYTIITQNFRHKKAEIDLIVRKGKILVFVEVKTRTNTNFGEPETFVTANQRKQIHTAAGLYISRIDWQHDIRFDIVAITLGATEEVLHIEDAFY